MTNDIIEYANKVCFENFIKISDNSIVSFDSSWEHRRKSFQCFGALIDNATEKVFSYHVIQDKKPSPQSLEIKVLQEMKNIYFDPRIKGHAQDGDVNTIKLIRSWKNSIKIYYNPNHIKGKFVRILEKFNYNGKGFFNLIREKLLSFFKAITI